MEFNKMKDMLRTRLKGTRYRHSIGVCETAVKMAERFGVKVEKARIAGLLHDCAREIPLENMRQEAEARHIPYTEVERQMPILLHAYIGAWLCKERYGVDDKEILDAVYRHTTGGAGMTALDKIIYIADMIEPNREYPGVDELRNIVEKASLDEAVLAGFDRSISFIVRKRRMIHPDTVLARNEILLRG
jgi:predicted HD superfamily hydrolase involved in NAD metabolism